MKVFTLRIDEQIFIKAQKNAILNKRSVSKEIEYVLEKAYKNSKPNN